MQEPWWKESVVYQVYPRSFMDSDGDGIGDLRGIIRKLDYLHDLGVDVLWVSPFYRSPMVDNGYDVSDFRDVDPMFGTLADVDELIDQLHRRGMKLVIDMVLNHTSDQHPWFVESRSSVGNDKRDWYWWRPPREGMEPGDAGAEPTNWRSYFSERAWELDETTGQYYLHLFTRQQPDLNWENPEVRQELYAMLRWWLDRGVDGFRLDVINLVSKRLPLLDGRPIGHGGLGNGAPFFENGPRIHEFLQEMHREVIAPSDKVLMTVGEILGASLEEAKLYTDPNRRELDMVFQFEHVTLDQDPDDKFAPRPTSLVALKSSLGRWQEAMAEVGWNSLYWNNHDQPRAVSRFGSDDPAYRELSAKLLGTVLHLHHGTPYVYQGEELGMTNYRFESIEDFRDVDSLNYYLFATSAGTPEEKILAGMAAASRDNGRSPMQWDDRQNAGFTDGDPWMPVNPNYTEINAAAQVNDPESVFSHYRKLIRLRHDMPVIAYGAFHMLLPDHEQLYAFTRRLDAVALLVVANFGEEDLEVDLPEAEAWSAAELLSTNYPGDEVASGPGTLRPWEARIYRRVED